DAVVAPRSPDLRCGFLQLRRGRDLRWSVGCEVEDLERQPGREQRVQARRIETGEFLDLAHPVSHGVLVDVEGESGALHASFRGDERTPRFEQYAVVGGANGVDVVVGEPYGF